MKGHDDTSWLITSTGPDYEQLMGFYEGISREAAMRDFARAHFKPGATGVLYVRSVGAADKIQVSYEVQMKLVAF